MSKPIKTSNSVCGVWIDEDDDTGRKISDYIRTHTSQEVTRVDLNNLSFLKEGEKHLQYFALLSKESLDRKNHALMAFLTSVLYHLHYLKLISNVVLVIVDEKVKEKHLPINLKSFDRVNAFPPLNESDLSLLCCKVSETPKLGIKKTLPVGNVGIGLAWSYYYGYLALILPGLHERIKKSQIYKDHEETMSKQFIIIIPKSSKTPASFKDFDARFSTVGPLDDGFQKSRAGHPSRLYKNFVHKIESKKNKKDYFFCGEFATPVLALQKMLEDPTCDMDRQETEKQMVLFRHTLMSILNHERNPECFRQAYIYYFADEQEGVNLADDLSEIIDGQQAGVSTPGGASDEATSRSSTENSTFVSSGTFSTIVSIPSMTIVCAEDDDGLRWEQSIREFCAAVEENFGSGEMEGSDENAVQCYSVQTYHSLEELQPKLVNPSIVDKDLSTAEKTVSDKLMIIVSEGMKAQIQKHADGLITHPAWFPRATLVVDLPKEDIPDWLEKSGVDYINTRKYDDIWKRIFGSLFGTSSVVGIDDVRWKKSAEGIQYQTDRLPIGNVAEGLALGYYHNYLTIVGPSIAERIQKSEFFVQGKTPSKLIILLPHSCFSHPELEKADIAITSAGKLPTLTLQIAGNKRNYDNPMHKVTVGGQTYYACVEYCTPVLVMYEMEAEGKAGLTPKQKEDQLHVFHQVLQRLLDHPDAPSYCQDIKLVLYDDKENKPLSQRLEEQIKEYLEEEDSRMQE